MEGSIVLFWDGASVTLPIPIRGGSPEENAAAAAAQIRAYLDAGFSVSPQGGMEKTALIGVIVRRQHVKDGKRTPVIDMYRVDQFTQKRWLGVYLNTPDDIARFERAAGIRLQDIPLLDADAPLQLDAQGQAERIQKYAFRCPRPFRILWKLNPKYAPGDKKTPKRLLVDYLPEAERVTERATEDRPVESPPDQSKPIDIRSTGESAVDGQIVKPFTALTLFTDERGEWMVSTEIDGVRRAYPASIVRGWSLAQQYKDALRRDRQLNMGLLAVYRDGVLIDVHEQEIEF